MSEEPQIRLKTVQSITQIGAKDWDICACPECADGGRPFDPFTTYRFLHALEQSQSVHPRNGWQPQYLVVKKGNLVIGVAPLYVKSHSQGEYIFDHNFAEGYYRAGGQYYPKLQIAVPFTPATGRRLLVRAGYEEIAQSALLRGAQNMALQNQLSSLHITFCTQQEAQAGQAQGMLMRQSQQFHWHNADYTSFDDFLTALSSRKRKNIRKERAIAQGFGGDIITLQGDAIQPEHWAAFWRFYQDTGARKWGTPYLSRAFFDYAHSALRDDIYLVMAKRNDAYVAGALNFLGRNTVYGRYWGCIEDHPCLHFEMCYYRAIHYAIKQGFKRVEAGAQGEHKLARGYLPSPTFSLHWFADKNFSDAVAQYLQAEGDAINADMQIMTQLGPFKNEAAK